jgi:hypothetical protein
LPFAVWLALAKATPMLPEVEPVQNCLANEQAIEQNAHA